MYVSFDDGDHWQSLMLNLPKTSYPRHRDQGQRSRRRHVRPRLLGARRLSRCCGSSRRQVAGEPAHLFKPGDAVRVRRNVGRRHAVPARSSARAQSAGRRASSTTGSARGRRASVTLDVLDASGSLVRHLSSMPSRAGQGSRAPAGAELLGRAAAALPADTGTNRTTGICATTRRRRSATSYEINANPGLTPPSPEGPLAPPGTYTIKLTVDGKSYTQPLTVHNDPRSPATVADLRAQHALHMKIDSGLRSAWDGYGEAAALRAAATAVASANASTEAKTAVASFVGRIDSVAGNPGGPRRLSSRSRDVTDICRRQRRAGWPAQRARQWRLGSDAGMLAAYSNACSDLRTAATALTAS